MNPFVQVWVFMAHHPIALAVLAIVVIAGIVWQIKQDLRQK